MLALPLVALQAQIENDTEIFEEEEVLEFELNDFYSIKLRQISESEYTAKEKESEHLRHKPYKVVTDVNKAKKMLGKMLKNVTIQDGNDTRIVVEITFKDKTKKRLDWCNLENGFVAYYPECNVLCFLGEAESDYVFDLNDYDKSVSENVGNPLYHILSPNKQLLISGRYSNPADCVWRFLEKWNPLKKKYEFINYLWGENHQFDFCNSDGWFWTSNNKILFKYVCGYGSYYEMELIEK